MTKCIAHDEQFCLLLQRFQKLSTADASKCIYKLERVNIYLTSCWKFQGYSSLSCMLFFLNSSPLQMFSDVSAAHIFCKHYGNWKEKLFLLLPQCFQLFLARLFEEYESYYSDLCVGIGGGVGVATLINPLLHRAFHWLSALQSSDKQFRQSKKLKDLYW